MKKYIAILVCAVLLTGLTACGNDTPKGEDTPTTQSTVTTTAAGESSTTDGAATTTTAPTDVDGTTTTSPTDGTTAPTETGAPSAPTTPTKGPSSSASATASGSVTTTVSRPTAPTASATKPTSTTSTTVTTQPTVPQPKVDLPAVGSDIDVVKQKDRIRVSAATAVYNKDGSIAVSLTFTNYSSNWITEETDWVEYTCYDKSGNVVQKATKLYIGCIDTKKNSVKTYTFDVPAATAEVRLTDSKIVYWTEWS